MESFRMLAIVLLIVVWTIYDATGDGSLSDEPTCYSKFDYDYKIMQKLSYLESEQKVLLDKVFKQANVIDDLQKELKDSAQEQWGEWTSWSKCSFKCSGQDDGRYQTRERTRLKADRGKQSETESRPCNAVQFAGCIRNYGTDDNFGVTYDFADEVAMSTCTALPNAKGHVYAVRRLCTNLAVSCEDTCKNLKLTCINSLHVYRRDPVLGIDDVGMKGLHVYRYNGCGGGCGPNFCCCIQ